MLYIISDGKTQSGIVIIIVKKLVRVVFMVQNKLLSKTADSGFPRKVNGSFATNRRNIRYSCGTDVDFDNLHYIGFRMAFRV